MSGPPPKTTQTKNTHPIPGQKLKFLTPQGIKLGPAGWKAGTLPPTPRRRMIQGPTHIYCTSPAWEIFSKYRAASGNRHVPPADTFTVKMMHILIIMYRVILTLEAPNFCLYVGHFCEFCDETLCTHTLNYALLYLMLKMVPSLIRTRLYTPLQIPEHFY